MSRKPAAAHERGEILGAGEAAHARRKVRVRLPARQHLARERDEAVEPEAEERLQEPARPGDLEHGDLPVGTQHARELGEPAAEVLEIPNPEADGHGVELAVRERKRERVALHPFDRARLLASAFEHRLGEVEPDDPPAAPLGLDREVSRPAAGVEHAIARPDDLLRGEPAPAAVEPGRHRPVHHVVHGRDAVEHLAHLVGRERPGLVGHFSPQRAASVLSIPSWSRQRATTKFTRSSTESAPW